MGIAQKVARNFSDAVRSRGQSYFVKGRVTVMAARAGEVVARVRGTSKYRVRLRMRGSKLLASCTCPYFSPQGEPCKHLWATLLLAEARGLLQSPPVFPVHLVTESPRRSSTAGLPEPRSEAGLERESPQRPVPVDTDLGMEMIGLGPSRPVGPGARGGKPKGKERGIRRDPPGEPGSWSQRGHAPRDYRAGASGRPKAKAGRHGLRAGADQGRQSQRQAAVGLRARCRRHAGAEPGGHRPGPPPAQDDRRVGTAAALVLRPARRPRQVRPRGPSDPGSAR